MVGLDESGMEEEEVVENIEAVVKIAKAHSRPIVALHTFRHGRNIGVVTVSHDSAKFWMLKEDREKKTVTITEEQTLGTWNHSVQSADVSHDGEQIIVIGIDSFVHDITLKGNHHEFKTRDFGFMETMHVSIASTKNTFLTSNFSGGLSEIEIGTDTVFRRETFLNSKLISCLKYSNDMKYIAVGQTDGVIELFETATFKAIHKFEVHSMKIRKIEFLPGDERFLTACDDKTIKLNSVIDLESSETNRTSKAIRTYSAHNAPVIGLVVDERSGGTRFASSSQSGQIFLWHIEISTPIRTVQTAHQNFITGLAFSPTSRHLLSAADDLMICCYRIPASGEESPIPDEEEDEETMPVDTEGDENMEIAEQPLYFVDLSAGKDPTPQGEFN